MISWLGNLEESPSNPKRYDAYHNTVDGCSYIYDGANWTLLASKGDKGDAGTNGRSIVWKGTFYTHPENPQELWTYYNATDGNAYIYSNGSWSLLIGNLSSPSITGTIVANGDLYSVSDVYIKVVDESSNNTVWNSLPAADGDFAVSGLDASRTYKLHFSSKRLSDVNITNSKALTTTTEDVSFGAIRTNVTPLSGKAQDLGSIVLSTNGTVHGSVVIGGDSKTSGGVDVFLDGTPYATKTDSNGEYTIKGILQGSYSIVFRKDGYITQTRDLVVFSSNPSEVPSIEVPSVKLVMGSCTLKGTVGYEDRTDMSGINVVLIASNGDVCRTSMTEKDGSFSFEGVSPDTYTIRAGADGYTTVDRRISISMGESYVVPMGSLVNLCGSITGSVATNDSGLKSGVKVKAASSSGGRSYEATTDETGLYTLSNVLHGDYVLTFEKDGYEAYTTNVTVEPGRTSTADAQLKSRFGSIRVRVSFVDKDDPSGIVVNVYRDGTLVFSATTTSTGIIVIANLPIGDGYSVIASSDGYGSSGEDKVTVSSGTVSELNLQKLSNRYGSLKGRVVDANGDPIESATVSISSSDGNSYTLTTSKDGTFSKTDVAVGTYTVSAGKADFLTTTLPQTYTVEPSLVTEVKDDIVLVSRYADIAGRVSYADKEDASNISVTIEDDKGRTLGTVVTGSTGSYSFKVESGTYYIRANAQGYFESSKVVNVVSGNDYTIELEDIRSRYGSIKGRVVDAGGSPIGSASVNLSSDNGNSYTLATVNDGTFSKTDVAIGTYSISVSKEDYLVATLPMECIIESSQVTEINDDIVLVSKYAEVRGKASYIGKNDASNISVTIEDSEGRILGTVVTGFTGAYSFKVESGTYRLRANSQGCFESYRVFTVVAGNSYDIDVNGLVLMYGSVSGKVKDQNGVAIEGATIRLVSVDGSSIYTCTSGSDGSFSNNQVLVGDYSVYVGKTGFQTVALPLEYGIESSMDTSIGVVALTSEYAEINGSVGYSDRTDPSGILVTIEDSSGKTIDSFTVGSDGTFSFRVSSGTFLIRANAFGYSEKTKTITVVSGNDYAVNIENVESMFGAIKGCVVDACGNPIESAMVSISSSDGSSYTLTTSKDGTFSKTDVAVGTYTISAGKAGYLTMTISQTYTVESSLITEVKDDIVLVSRYADITGKVSYADKEDASNIFVTIEDSEGRILDTVVTGITGEYSFKVESGIYCLKANANEYFETSKVVNIASGNKYTVELEGLKSMYGSVSGNILTSKGDVVEGATIRLESNDGTAYTASSLADGSFLFEKVSIGDYSISVSKLEFQTVALSLKYSVESSKRTAIDAIVLTSEYADINGSVGYSDRTDPSGILVTIEDSSGRTIDSFAVGSDGTFSFRVPAGTFTIKANADGYAEISKNITVVVEKTYSIDIGKINTLYGSIAGKVVDADGNAVSGAVVNLTNMDGVGDAVTLSTNENGEFSSSTVPIGTYTVSITKSGYIDVVCNDVPIVGGRTYDVGTKALVSGTAGITGRVVLEGASNYSGVTVSATSLADSSKLYTTTTTEDGLYYFVSLNVGTWLLKFQKDGYLSVGPEQVPLASDTIAEVKVITLRNENSIVKGTVSLKGSSSFPGVNVLLKNSSDGTTFSTTTDIEGRYVIPNVKPGSYELVLSKEGYSSTTMKDIHVDKGTTKVIDEISLDIAVTSIRGQVSLELRTDLSGALVTATSISNPDVIYSAITNSQGVFTFAKMYSGEYQIVVSCNGYSSITLPTVKVVDDKPMDVGSVSLKIERGTIAGIARLEGHSNHSGVKVTILGTDYEATTAADGSYSFNVPAGNYPGGLRLEYEDFETTSYASTIPVLTNSTYAIPDMELKCLRTSIHGKVDVLTTDDEGGVTIGFDGDASISPFVTTSTGEFLFEHVPLGDYAMRFRREDCSDMTIPVKVVASEGIELSTITLTPNTATLTGKVTLKDALTGDGVKVSVDMGDGRVRETSTDMSGRYELGGVSIADAYTVRYSKEGWNGSSQAMASRLEALERRELPEVFMTDTTAPVLKSITINNGSNTTADRNVVIHVDAEDFGSGCRTVIINDFNSSDSIGYATAVDWTLEGVNGEKTVYVKVIDRAGNESDIVSATVTLTDQKTEVKGVLKGDGLAWTKERSPYLVTGNLLVEKDDVLKIEPGVDVQFEGDYYLQVEGRLEAKGTEGERISIYGIGAGEDNWSGMKFVNDNGSVISHASVSGLKNGISGYCDIDHALITANGWAVGNRASSGDAYCLSGNLKDSMVNGNVSVKNGFVASNEIDGATIYLYSANVDGNTFEGKSLETSYCFVYNNHVSTDKVASVQDVQKYVTYNNCELQIGFDTDYSKTMRVSALSRIQFNSCTFPKLAASVNDSNFMNCGPITITTDRKDRSEFDLTGNHWGELNTVELDSNGDGSNMGFINDYYDDFNLSKVLYSDWKGSTVVDAGYQGEGFGRDELTTTVYSIGDLGPAGGLVFYDKGFYSDGWRYLEAAPSDIGNFVFGYYRPDKKNNNVVGTSLAIGSGKYNTERLVKHMDMDGKAYSGSSGEDVKEYAARKCFDYSYGGYDDWFLPCRDELKLMYENLHKKGLGSFASNNCAWASSENIAYRAWVQWIYDDGGQSDFNCSDESCVCPVRAF